MADKPQPGKYGGRFFLGDGSECRDLEISIKPDTERGHVRFEFAKPVVKFALDVPTMADLTKRIMRQAFITEYQGGHSLMIPEDYAFGRIGVLPDVEQGVIFVKFERPLTLACLTPDDVTEFMEMVKRAANAVRQTRGRDRLFGPEIFN